MRPGSAPGFQSDGTLPSPAPILDVLSPAALGFIRNLAQRFRGSLPWLLAERGRRQAGFDHGLRPGWLAETEDVRYRDWTVAPLPEAFLGCRTEATCPPERDSLAAALNSGARTCLVDLEDSLVPTLDNLEAAQRELIRTVRSLAGRPPLLQVRPRGLHLRERHLEVDGEPVPACLFDAGLFLFHNAQELLAQGAVPWLCLGKLEHHLEARWWNQVLEAAECELGLPAGSVRTTLMIETLPAAFQMDELLHEQRSRAAALGLGRREFFASFIKTLRSDPAAILPDPAELGPGQPCLRACARLLASTCRHRGALALGRPHGAEPEEPAVAPEQTALELLAAPAGPRTEAALRTHLRVGIHYLEAWLRGQGWVPLYGRMEDAAGVELARLQLWQWVNHGVPVAGLGALERPLFHGFVHDALNQIQAEVGAEAFADGRYLEAADLLETLILLPEPPPFLTLSASELLAGPVLSEVI